LLFQFRFSNFEHARGRDEGSFVGQEDLREMQDCAPGWGGEGDLRKPEAQAAARMSPEIQTRNWKIETRRGFRQLTCQFRISSFGFRFSNFDYRISIFEFRDAR
jgi:hypothetical protein